MNTNDDKIQWHPAFDMALADTIMRANWKELEEERKMCDALRELFADDLRESREEGRNAGKIEGAASKMIELVIKKYQKGLLKS